MAESTTMKSWRPPKPSQWPRRPGRFQNEQGNYIGHRGPLAVYFSKAPEMAKGYKGDGDWFKVYESSLSSNTVDPMGWASFVGGVVRNFTFTLPKNLPAGEYLMLGEHLALQSAELYQAQFYMGCAPLKVTGSCAGTSVLLARLSKFPGAYDPRDPGNLVNMYWPHLRQHNPPGPKTWPVTSDDSTVNVFGQESDGDCTPLEESAQGDPCHLLRPSPVQLRPPRLLRRVPSQRSLLLLPPPSLRLCLM